MTTAWTTTTLVALVTASLVAMTTAESCDMQQMFESSGIVVGGNISTITRSSAATGGYDVTIDVFCVYKGAPTQPRITVHNVGMVEGSLACDLTPDNTYDVLSKPGPKFIYFVDAPYTMIKLKPSEHFAEYFDEIMYSCGVNSPTLLPVGTQGSEIKCFERIEDEYYTDACLTADGELKDFDDYEMEKKVEETISPTEAPKPEPETPQPEPVTSMPETKTDPPAAATSKAMTEAKKPMTKITTAAPATEKADKGYEIEDNEEDNKEEEPEANVGAAKADGNNSGTTVTFTLAALLLAMLTALNL